MSPDPLHYENLLEYIEQELPGQPEEIGILSPEFSEFDGIGRVAEYQARVLADNGYSVQVVTLNNEMEGLEDVSVREIDCPDQFHLNRIFRVAAPITPRIISIARELSKIDLLIAHQYPFTLVAGVARRMNSDVEYILYNHGEPTQSAIKNHLSQNTVELVYNSLMIELGKIGGRSADRAISISEFARERLLTQINLDSVVIYNEIDERFHTDNDPEIIYQKHSLKPETEILLFVGRIDPSKGLTLLIEAFDRLAEEQTDCKLLIVGKPSYEDYFEKLQSMANDSVIFTGFVPDEELPNYYAACDVYTTASLWEGYNLPMAEAQACGCPVVAFDIGPHSELLENGKLVKPEDTQAFASAVAEYLAD
ncbi:glycosyltransferase [Halobellus sp. GM3]|uniref:glycosyltransferase n=1 Tax=Halobellus sp. GM3 TaxID=3458410 RepID=UPI00403DF146